MKPKTIRPKSPAKKYREALLHKRMAQDLTAVCLILEKHKPESQKRILRAAWELLP